MPGRVLRCRATRVALPHTRKDLLRVRGDLLRTIGLLCFRRHGRPGTIGLSRRWIALRPRSIGSRSNSSKRGFNVGVDHSGTSIGQYELFSSARLNLCLRHRHRGQNAAPSQSQEAELILPDATIYDPTDLNFSKPMVKHGRISS